MADRCTASAQQNRLPGCGVGRGVLQFVCNRCSPEGETIRLLQAPEIFLATPQQGSGHAWIPGLILATQ